MKVTFFGWMPCGSSFWLVIFEAKIPKECKCAEIQFQNTVSSEAQVADGSQFAGWCE